MNAKIVSVIALSTAVIAAAISGVVITNNRADAARALLQKAESEESAAQIALKQARAEESAAASRAAAKASEAETERENREAKEAEKAIVLANEKKSENDKIIAKDNREAAKARAAEAEAKRDEERAKAAAAKAEADKARAAADAEKAKADAAAAEAAKAEANRLAKEAETLKLRTSMSELEQLKRQYEAYLSETEEFRRDLEEREAALHPDKSAADLQWVGEREADIIGGDTNSIRRLRKGISPENDPELPAETRRLARAKRLANERFVECQGVTSNAVISTLERLHEEALRTGRTVDAAYYRKAIKGFCPNWKYRAPKVETAKKENKQGENK